MRRSSFYPSCHLPCLFLLLAAGMLPAQAETYRWSDPKTGRTVVSDTPPPRTVGPVGKAAAPDGDKPLPLALQKAVANFPVTLYVSTDCGQPCTDARQLLTQRGIPFAEKDAQQHLSELKTLVGDGYVPTLQVGKQSSKGFLASGYHDLLDWAGYPGRPTKKESNTP